MKAIVIDRYVQGPQHLTVTTLPDPIPNPNELLIEIHASATNFFDILQIQGKYQTQPPFPWIAGFEFAGIVLSAPPSSTFKPGDKVFGGSQGAYAERICVPDSPSGGTVFKIPHGWDFVDACGLYVTAPTSYLALVNRAHLKRGETCLVHAAAGGVGLAAVQIAKVLGAKVIATASTRDKLDIARRYGADLVVDYTEAGWVDRVKEMTGGRGVDVVYDPVGLVDKSLKVIAWNGRICVVGFAAGQIEKVAMNKVLLKQCSLVGVFWGGNTKMDPKTVAPVWKELLSMMASKQLRPTVFSKVYAGLDNVGNALQALGSRQTWGKVVIDLKQDDPTISKL